MESIKIKLENAKISKNLRIIVILFAFFMLPKQVLWLWLDFGNGGKFKHFSDVLTFGEFLLYIHSSTNPIVYGAILGEYRAGFRRYLRHFFSVIGWHDSKYCTSRSYVCRTSRLLGKFSGIVSEERNKSVKFRTSWRGIREIVVLGI